MLSHHTVRTNDWIFRDYLSCALVNDESVGEDSDRQSLSAGRCAKGDIMGMAWRSLHMPNDVRGSHVN